MKKVLPDTNVIIRLLCGDGTVAEELSHYDRIVISTVVLGEFRAGIDLATNAGRAQKKAIAQLLDSASVEIAAVTEDTTEEYAGIFRVLKEKGRPIPLNDIWIAAHALEHNAYLYSADAHFAEIPLLKRI